MWPGDLICCCCSFFTLLVMSAAVAVGTRNADVKVVCDPGDICVLPCTAKVTEGVRYRAVRWYQVGEPPASRLSGLLSHDLLDGTTRPYVGQERQMELLNGTRRLLLANATCADAGVYACHLAAPVGQQNRDGRVLLALTDCHAAPTVNIGRDAHLVIFATAVLVAALLIFLKSYTSLKHLLQERNKTIQKSSLVDSPFKPLGKKDLMLIYTLGPKTSTMKHMLV